MCNRSPQQGSVYLDRGRVVSRMIILRDVEKRPCILSLSVSWAHMAAVRQKPKGLLAKGSNSIRRICISVLACARRPQQGPRRAGERSIYILSRHSHCSRGLTIKNKSCVIIGICIFKNFNKIIKLWRFPIIWHEYETGAQWDTSFIFSCNVKFFSFFGILKEIVFNKSIKYS